MFALALVVLRANCPRVPTSNLSVWIEGTSIELRVTEFTVFAGFKVDFKWVVDVVLVAKHLFVHIDLPVVDVVARKDRADLRWVKHLVRSRSESGSSSDKR